MLRPMLVACAIGLSLLSHSALAGQTATAVPRRPAQTVKVDLAAQQFETGLPFRERFWIRGTLANPADSIVLTYGVADRDENNRLFIRGRPTRKSIPKSHVVKSKDFAFAIEPLQPNVEYLFRFRFYEGAAFDTVQIIGRPKASLAQHFDADVGVLRSENAGNWGLVTSSHFHFIPINKNEDDSFTSGPGARLARQISMFGGIAFQEIYSEVEVSKFFTFGSPVAGVGIRGPLGLDFMRVNGGVIWFKQKDANPLISRQRVKRDVFVSATADLEMKQVLGPLVALLGIR
ncbi:MAG TPA: hypothetical protein VGR37_08620 [Longimicrobiaceae bacterium]|nr:hypothetical protein [Longimicrobiaceae bacterium]